MLKKGERGDGMDKLAVLRQYFGFPAFRAGQQTLIDAVLSGRDALGRDADGRREKPLL